MNDHGNDREKHTHKACARKAKVWPGFVSNNRVYHLPNDGDRGLGTICRKPYEGTVGRLLRVCGQINRAKVSIVRIIQEPDSGWVVENSG